MGLQDREGRPQLGRQGKVEVAQELASLHGDALELSYRGDDSGERIDIELRRLLALALPREAPSPQAGQRRSTDPPKRRGRQLAPHGEESALQLLAQRAIAVRHGRRRIARYDKRRSCDFVLS